MISPEQIENLARQNSIDRVTVLREYLQVVFLGNLYQAKPSQYVYFKGGTAIHLLFEGRRFSRDLDFTTTLTESGTLDLIGKTLIQMNQTVEPDLTLINEEKKHQSVTRRIVYDTPSLAQKLTVPVEFSLREKPFTEKETVMRTGYPVPFSPVVRHLDWPEVLTEKIRAIMTREMGRDIYDLWFLLTKNVSVDWTMVAQKMESYREEANATLLRERVATFPQKKLEQDLKPYLPATERDVLPPRLKNLALEELERAGSI